MSRDHLERLTKSYDTKCRNEVIAGHEFDEKLIVAAFGFYCEQICNSYDVFYKSYDHSKIGYWWEEVIGAVYIDK